VRGDELAKYCKYDDTPTWPCRWKGEPTAGDFINCQLFSIKNTQYRLMKSFEETRISSFEKAFIEAVRKMDSRVFDKAAKEAAEEVLKAAKEAEKRLKKKK
jgi:hypothetical protein